MQAPTEAQAVSSLVGPGQEDLEEETRIKSTFSLKTLDDFQIREELSPAGRLLASGGEAVAPTKTDDEQSNGEGKHTQSVSRHLPGAKGTSGLRPWLTVRPHQAPLGRGTGVGVDRPGSC